MSIDALRQSIADFLRFQIPNEPMAYDTLEDVPAEGYRRLRIRYWGDAGDEIAAYFLLPEGEGPFPAVLVHHQHNGERHLGKSEVVGLAGDPLQAIGPYLAQHKVAVLAPDSICFEDRRSNRQGIDPDPDQDWRQHYNALCFRLLQGDTLMRKVLDDAARGVSFLAQHPLIDAHSIGTYGHSYGGNTVLFLTALDERLAFACSSGAACSYAHKFAHATSIEMAEVIPNFAQHFDIPDLLRCFAPRPTLILSASEDIYAVDAPAIVAQIRPTFEAMSSDFKLWHLHFNGGHPLTDTRTEIIQTWLTWQAHLGNLRDQPLLDID